MNRREVGIAGRVAGALVDTAGCFPPCALAWGLAGRPGAVGLAAWVRLGALGAITGMRI